MSLPDDLFWSVEGGRLFHPCYPHSLAAACYLQVLPDLLSHHISYKSQFIYFDLFFLPNLGLNPQHVM